MKKIYILLSKTETFPSKVIHFFKRGPYTHVSVSMLPATDCFYSYARRNPKIFFLGGLISEDIHAGIFAQHEDCSCALFSLEVTEEEYEEMNQKLLYYWENYKKSSYNILGTLLMAFGIRMKRKYKLTCSQFVALILSCAPRIHLPKDPYLMLPNDFIALKELSLLYNGSLKCCTDTAFSQGSLPI